MVLESQLERSTTGAGFIVLVSYRLRKVRPVGWIDSPFADRHRIGVANLAGRLVHSAHGFCSFTQIDDCCYVAQIDDAAGGSAMRPCQQV